MKHIKKIFDEGEYKYYGVKKYAKRKNREEKINERSFAHSCDLPKYSHFKKLVLLKERRSSPILHKSSFSKSYNHVILTYIFRKFKKGYYTIHKDRNDILEFKPDHCYF